MPSDGGHIIVGTIAVKVTPDTNDFRRKAESQINRELKGVEAEVPVSLDKDKLKAEIKALRASLKELAREKIKLNVELDTDSFMGEFEKLKATVRKEKLRVDVGVGAVDLGELDKIKKRMESASKADPAKLHSRVVIDDNGPADILNARPYDVEIDAHVKSPIKGLPDILQSGHDHEVELDLKVSSDSMKKAEGDWRQSLSSMQQDAKIDLDLSVTGRSIAAMDSLVDRLKEAHDYEGELARDFDDLNKRMAGVEKGSFAFKRLQIESQDLDKAIKDNIKHIRVVEEEIGKLDKNIETTITLRSDLAEKELKRWQSVHGIDIPVNIDIDQEVNKAFREMESLTGDAEKAVHRLDYALKGVSTSELQRSLRTLNEESKALQQRNTDLRASYRNIVKEMDSVGSESPFFSMLESSAKDLEKELEDVGLQLQHVDRIASQIDREITLSMVTEVDRSAYEDAKNKLDDLKEKIEPEVHPDVAGGAIRAAAARLAVLTRDRVVNIVPELSKSGMAKVESALAALSGARVGKDLFDGLKEMVTGLDRALPKILALGTAFGGAAPAVLALSSNVLALGGSLTSVLGVALPLPGILGGLAVGAWATVRAFQDFNKQMPGVSQAFSQMQSQMSSNFWEKARAPMREMIDKLLPEFSAGFQKTGTALGGFFGKLSASIQSAFAGKLTPMFDQLTRSIDIAGKGTDAFAGIIAKLGTFGAQYLPRLSQSIVDISTKFDGWLSSTEGENKLKSWTEAGIQALKDLGGIIVSTVSIFAGLSNAAQAAGGSGLGALNAGLKSVADTVNGPAFQNELTGVFKSAHAAMGLISKESGPGVTAFFKNLSAILQTNLPVAGEAFGMALGAIGDALGQVEVHRGVTALFGGIHSAVVKLAPAMGPLGVAFGSLMEIAGNMLDKFSGPISTALTGLSQMFTNATPGINKLVNVLSAGLGGAISFISPMLPGLGSAFSSLASILAGGLGSTLSSLAPKFMQVASVIGGQFMSTFNRLKPTLVEIGQKGFALLKDALAAILPVLPKVSAFFAKLLEVLLPLVPPMLDFARKVIPKLIEGFGKIMDAGTKLLGALQPVISFIGTMLPYIGTALGFVIDMVTSAISGIINGVTNIVSGLTSIFSGVINIVKGAFNVIVGIFTLDGGKIKEGFSQIWNGVVEIVKGVFQTIWGVIETAWNVAILLPIGKGLSLLKGIFTTGWNVLKGVVVAVWNAIKAFFTGEGGTGLLAALKAAVEPISGWWSTIWNGIKTAFEFVWNGIKTVALAIWNALKAAFTAAWTGVKATWDFIWNGLQATFTAVWTAIQAVALAVWTALTVSFSTIWNTISTVWNTVWSTIQTVFTTVWTALQTTAMTIWNALGTAFSAAWTGIQAVWSAVWSAIQTVFSTIWNTIKTLALLEWNGLKTFFSAVWNGVSAVWSAVWNAVSATFSAVWNAISATASAIWNGIKATFMAVWNGISAAASAIWNGMKATASAVWNGIKAAISAAITAVRTVVSTGLNAAKAVASAAWNAIKTAATTAWNAIKTAVSTAINAVKSTITTGLNAAKAVASAAWNAIKTAASTAWNAIKTTVSTAISNVKTTVSNGLNNVKTAVSNGMNAAKTTFTNAWNAIKTTVSTKISEVVSLCRGIPGKIKSAIGDLGSLLVGAGKKVIDGLISGIKGGIGKVKDVLGGITSKIPSWKGPPERDSILLVDAGRLIMAGLVDGIEDGVHPLSKKLAEVTDIIEGTKIDSPSMGMFERGAAAARKLRREIGVSLDSKGGGDKPTRVLNYYAAPGSSLGAEEDLFAAAARERMTDW